jgi:hypothetical protein
MKFTVEPAPFLRIVELADEQSLHRMESDIVLCLGACDQRVWVKCGNTVAETEAMVWENGQCRVSRAELLKALDDHRDELELLIEGNKRGLRVGQLSLPVSRYDPCVVLPNSVQVFLASNLGMIHWSEAEVARA